jgi:hypothetical protein
MTPRVRTYDHEANVRLDAGFTNESGGAADPTTVVCTVEAPSGSTSTPAVTHDGLGAYHAFVIANEPGTWHYAFEGSGALVARSEWRFLVRQPQVP